MLVRVAVVLTLVLLLPACAAGSSDPGEGASFDPSGEPSEAAPTETEDAASAETLDEDALARVTQAAANTTDAGTARFELSMTTEGTGGTDGRQPVTVQGDEDFEAQQRALTFAGPDGDLDVVVDKSDVYVQVPATEDDDWARIELDKVLQDDVGFGGVGGLPFQSPSDNLAVLEEAVTAAEEGGEEDVRGEPSTRFDLVVDLEAAAEQGASDTRDALTTAAQESGVTELDMQVWVNDDDLVNRISYSIDLSQADTEEVASELASEGVDAGDVDEPSGRVTVDVEYYDFGADVSIVVPDDANVVDIDEDEVLDSFGQ